MTASTNTNFDLNRTGIIRVAYQLVGIVPAGQDPTSEQLAMGTDFLQIGLFELQEDGIQLCRVIQTTDSLVAGTPTYTTATNTLDIDEHTVYVSNSGTGSQRIDLPLRKISRGEYMALVTKQVQSQPSMIYVEKGASSVTYSVYPTPDGNWPTITYPRVVLTTNMDSAAVNTGLPSRYLRVVTLMTAIMLADHHGKDARKASLKADLEEAREKANNDDTERGPIRFIPEYGIQFGRRF